MDRDEVEFIVMSRFFSVNALDDFSRFTEKARYLYMH